MAAINTYYPNFVLENEIEDQYNSLLDLQRFCTVDNTLEGTPGMIKKINVYSATNGTEDVAIGVGNTQTITVTYAQETYEIKTAQNRFAYLDEEIMADPMVLTTGLRHMAVDMFNHVNADVFNEFKKAAKVLPVSAINFDAFADAVAALNVENIEGLEVFAFVNPKNMAVVRKAMKDTLQYVEAFARQGYVGTVAGVNLYQKKDADSNAIIVATREAVTLFNKLGVQVEQPTRDADDANIRKNTVFSRKYYLAALTNEKYAVKVAIGATATATTDTSVNASKTYYAAADVGYIRVTPAAGDNPQTKGWYEIA